MFEGRRQLIAYYFMWFDGRPAAEQCEGCTFYTTQVGELDHLHSRDVTYATLCQGPYEESARYRDFMQWTMPWYSARQSLDTLLTDRQVGMFHLVCYRRDGDRAFETYWTNGRGVEAMGNTYSLLDLTVQWSPGDVGGLAGGLAETVGRRRRAALPQPRTSRSRSGPGSRMGTRTDEFGGAGRSELIGVPFHRRRPAPNPRFRRSRRRP